MQTSEMQIRLIEKLIFATEKQISDVYEYFFKIKRKDTHTKNVEIDSQNKFFTGKTLADSEFIGIWENKNIKDSLAFADNLRNKAQNRNI
ncbi:MAG: hypothetical protein KIT33_00925 [Candidatus Kapabacteria bacterium]|nr:hypothetical protein [Ignavibacteriota bacterium]MCW5883510.1 hypothetical protein [Candidatus Kapabacteria bacterium]